MAGSIVIPETVIIGYPHMRVIRSQVLLLLLLRRRDAVHRLDVGG